MIGASLLILSSIVLCLPVAGPSQVSPGDPDLKGSERMVREGRRALEEIVGRELLGAEAPPLPELPELGLSEAETALVTRLADAAPETWSAEERERIEELFPLDLRLRAALKSPEGEALDPEDVATRGFPLLRAGRLLAVRDRLALLEGDEAAFLDGLELRMDLAGRLWLQPAVIGPILGAAIFQPVLADVQRAAEREQTSGAGLSRLEALLLRWRDRVPDAAAVLAREGLLSLERSEELPGELGAGDPAAPLFMGPVAHDFALLARVCREEGCRAAVEALQAQREGRDGDPYRVISDILIPNLIHTAEKLDALSGVVSLASTAISLRLGGEESGRYPASLEDLTAPLPAGREGAAGWSYEPRPDGGARLRWTGDGVASPWPEPRRAQMLELLTWELPAPTGERRPPPADE